MGAQRLSDPNRVSGAPSGNAEATNERIRSAMDNLLEGCQILDRDLRYRYLNQAAEIHNRRPNEELLGQHYVESWPGIEATEVYRRIVDCLALRCADHMEHEFTYPDGKVGWFELRLEPVPDGLLIMSVDITEHKLTQARLRHVNNVLRATSEVNQLIVREKDSVKLAQGACDILVNTRSYRAVWIVVNDGVAVPTVAQTGWAEEFVDFRAKIQQCSRPQCWQLARQEQAGFAIIDPTTCCTDCPLRQNYQQRLICVLVLQHAAYDYGSLGIALNPGQSLDADEQNVLIGVANDLGLALHNIKTDSRRITYEQMVASSQDALALVDRNYVYVEANPSYLRFLGRDAGAVIGHRVQEVWGEEFFVDVVKARLDRSFAGETLAAEVSRDVPGIGCRIIEAHYSPCRARDGSVSTVVVNVHDITERRLAALALQEREDQLRALGDNLPDSYVYQYVHDEQG